MKLITKFYLIIILSSLFLFSCGKCDGILGAFAFDRKPPNCEQIQFSFIKQGFDTTDIFYNGSLSTEDLNLYIINEDNTESAIEFRIMLDTASKRNIIYPFDIFYNQNLGNIEIEFRLKINSQNFIIPISFIKSQNSSECYSDTYVSDIKVDNADYSINIRELDDYPHIFRNYYITIIVPRTKIP